MPPSFGGDRPTALITGAARRIGRAIALDLARHGWQVCVHYRRSEGEALALVDEIKSEGGVAAAVAADLSIRGDVEDLIPQCRRVLGTPVCLVNNASEFLVDSVTSVT